MLGKTRELNTARKPRKSPYVLGIALSFLWYGLSRLDGSIGIPWLWLIFLCSAFNGWICALKLRNMLHGTGWVFPRTNSVLLYVLSSEALLYLWLSH
jgi:hypothetical protein